MSRKDKLDQKIRNNPRNVKFQESIQWVESFGFELDHITGSHYIFRHPKSKGIINLQKLKSGNAKPYQIKQAITTIDRL